MKSLYGTYDKVGNTTDTEITFTLLKNMKNRSIGEKRLKTLLKI